MWIVAKIKKKELGLFKKELIKKLGLEIKHFYLQRQKLNIKSIELIVS